VVILISCHVTHYSISRIQGLEQEFDPAPHVQPALYHARATPSALQHNVTAHSPSLPNTNRLTRQRHPCQKRSARVAATPLQNMQESYTPPFLGVIHTGKTSVEFFILKSPIVIPAPGNRKVSNIRCGPAGVGLDTAIWPWTRLR
jgi:hypothetical protein